MITRQWRRNVDADFPGLQYGALVAQSCPAGGTWSEPTVIVVPAAPGYAIYYQKLALDHDDRLFLSCSYDGGDDLWEQRAWSVAMGVLGRGEITPGMYQRRMLLVSDDGGATWRFAQDSDLSPTPTPTPTPSASSAPRHSPTTAAPPRRAGSTRCRKATS